MSSLRFCFTSLTICSPRNLLAIPPQRINTFCCCAKPSRQNDFISEANTLQSSPPSASPKHSPLFGMDDTLVSYLCGKKKATDLAHMVWKHVVQKGDTVLDATCGNGFDTLAMLNLVADDSRKGYVYALDIQKDALDNTSILLEESLNPDERQLVKLVNICHSKMEEVVPRNALVRLVGFNLGYLPGGKKEIITRPETTFLALEAAERILMPGGLISIVVYVGHPGGRKRALEQQISCLRVTLKSHVHAVETFIDVIIREELEAVETFAARMPVENWICCKLRMVNRPCAPVPIFLFRR
ncbi:uncharacterized protein LOC107614427 isoform X1 [Arachis ipaensis]|uniref:uncharacterized protein LOC107614427 isoform X1 n=1 Tax=Arachis ipaensis TaxID=130454 RepID=UPI000A2B33C1|nr:uncharacterized protein LOC107614427 isoform X1 [Arachis ipaensis]XP_025673600.1 uncharacterized protein LOC112772806 isoform X1 [Arachis hypogaea]